MTVDNQVKVSGNIALWWERSIGNSPLLAPIFGNTAYNMCDCYTPGCLPRRMSLLLWVVPCIHFDRSFGVWGIDRFPTSHKSPKWDTPVKRSQARSISLCFLLYRNQQCITSIMFPYTNLLSSYTTIVQGVSSSTPSAKQLKEQHSQRLLSSSLHYRSFRTYAARHSSAHLL